MNRNKWIVLTVTVLVAVALVVLLMELGKTRLPATSEAKPLLMYCAAGIKTPVEAVAREYEQMYHVPVQLQYGGSGTLLGNLRVAKTGDLYLAADESYMKSARQFGLLAETIPLARQYPVIAVKSGNPKHIRTLEDLQRADVRVALANPDAASVGRTVRSLLQSVGKWAALDKHTAVFKPTVNDVANDVKIGSVDAGIVWSATARQYPELEIVNVPLFESATETINVGVLNSSKQPAAALRFARYLGARDKGLIEFTKNFYDVVDGDEWAKTPEIVLFSGAMLRPGIEKTLVEFEQREGCRITTVYNGCGILCAQMRAGERPDAYFSCDTSFMKTVADLYLVPEILVDNNLMILVQKGNPKGIHSITDLTKPGLRVGLPHHEKSAMGNIAWKMLKKMGLYDAISKNMVVESPTGDLLVNQLRTGSLDAIIACRTNYTPVRDYLDAIPIDSPLSAMAEPYAVGRKTRYKYLMTRLLEMLTSAESQKRFESVGFGWRYQPNAAQ
jgi:molybdate transport system substrate-binding protein